MNYSNRNTFQLYMRYKKKDLKWYKKLWNIITGHKDRNWEWLPINSKGVDAGVNITN